ncbi:MAG: cysteine--tRNA ligase [Pontimonas sp.]|nr:cysteine--tRNA ligase [Pontimonas sp.]
MAIRLYDSKRQDVVDFVPLLPGHVSLYVCGPTVQSAPHVGHLRSALVYDLWSRWFSYRGLQVTLVRNVTDIDDKILEKSVETGEAWWALAERVEREFHDATSSLHILPPTREPRATGDIPAMIELIGQLIATGHAYATDDGSGDVYFDVARWPSYGELTHQSVENLRGGSDAVGSKRNPEDFALWKGHKAGEPATASWPAPWGAGRPGWHIECSAMSMRYLGGEFDIHGGGVDLRFPHHENELAQSAAAGHGYARHWLHNALVVVGGQKMSKSLGNSVYAKDLLDKAPAIIVRYALASAHYRSELDLHDGFLDEATAAFSRIEGFLSRARQEGLDVEGTVVPSAFAAAMDEDLSVPAALAVVHETVRAGNNALDSGDRALAGSAASEVRAMVRVLGIDPLDPEWARGSSRGDGALASLVESVIELRWHAKAEKNFELSDALRDVLDRAGIDVNDGASGSTWSIRG